jgi:hypothetical protein
MLRRQAQEEAVWLALRGRRVTPDQSDLRDQQDRKALQGHKDRRVLAVAIQGLQDPKDQKVTPDLRGLRARKDQKDHRGRRGPVIRCGR